MTVTSHAGATTYGVVIPTFNRRPLLREALESVLKQTHTRLEILVIDNGSTDGTPDFMAGVKDPRVRYILNPQNLGMAGSINKAVRLLSDEVRWCTVLADDDLLAPTFIESLAEVTGCGAKSVLDSHRVFVDGDARPCGEANPAPVEEDALEYLEARNRQQRQTYLTGVLFSRDAFESIGGYPVFSSGLASDDAFIFALALRDKIVRVPRAVAFVRLHDEAESRRVGGALLKLATADQFASYCEKAVARAGFDGARLRQFERTLQLYRMGLKSYWWLAATWSAADQAGESEPGELTRLRALVRDDPHSFTSRVRFSAWLERLTGFDLESSRLRELGVFPLLFRRTGGKRRFSLRTGSGTRPA